MAIVIRQLRGSGNNQTISDKRIDRPQVSIGRGADQDILVNDPRVAWEHAEVRAGGLGGYSFEVLRDAGPVLLNGAPSRGSKLRDGDALTLGGSQIVFRLFEGQAYLEVREAPRVKDAQAAQLRAQSKLSLEEVGVSRRRWSWILFLLLLLITLLLPLASRFLPVVSAQIRHAPLVPSDAVWLSGPMSAAHESFGRDCEACHLEAFEVTPDRACLACHATVAHHDDDVALLESSGIEDYRCADCHHEHDGDEGLVLAHPSLCVDCHALPGSKMPGSGLQPVSDFDGGHPQFSPTVWRLDPQGQREAVSLSLQPGLREPSALIFPHDLHLDADGVEDRAGEAQLLDCQSCHEYQAGEVSFQAVDFEQHCQYCHSLEFEPSDPGREVPHGNTQAVLDDLRGYYARQVLQGTEQPPLTLPRGPRGRQRSVVLDEAERNTLLRKADGLARDKIDETIRVRLCAKCHTIGPAPQEGGADWDVEPFRQRAVWFEAARFDHGHHQTEGCESCHAASTSESADEVLLPGIDDCTGCHAGNASRRGRIRSLCIDCHGFHLAGEALMHGAARASSGGSAAVP